MCDAKTFLLFITYIFTLVQDSVHISIQCGFKIITPP